MNEFINKFKNAHPKYTQYCLENKILVTFHSDAPSVSVHFDKVISAILTQIIVTFMT